MPKNRVLITKGADVIIRRKGHPTIIPTSRGAAGAGVA